MKGFEMSYDPAWVLVSWCSGVILWCDDIKTGTSLPLKAISHRRCIVR